MTDTPPDVAAKFREMMLARPAAERSAMACRMFQTAKALIVAGVEHKHGRLKRGELRHLTFLRLYAQDFSDEESARIAQHIATT